MHFNGGWLGTGSLFSWIPAFKGCSLFCRIGLGWITSSMRSWALSSRCRRHVRYLHPTLVCLTIFLCIFGGVYIAAMSMMVPSNSSRLLALAPFLGSSIVHFPCRPIELVPGPCISCSAEASELTNVVFAAVHLSQGHSNAEGTAFSAHISSNRWQPTVIHAAAAPQPGRLNGH